MKTFKDLDFKPHQTGEGLQAVIRFDNNYGVSVVRFKIPAFLCGCDHYGSYTDNENEWELAVIYFDDETDNFSLTYNTDITDDVIGHLLENEVTEIMIKVQAL